MKYIKKFNEELDNETYLSAADKLKHNHPNRSKKLKDYVKTKSDLESNIYNILFYGDVTGTAKAKLVSDGVKIYLEVIEQNLNSTKTGIHKRKFSPSQDSRMALKNTLKPVINNIKIGNGLFYVNRALNGLSGDCFCVSRIEANRLKKELSEVGVNISVNSLYTDMDIDKPAEPKKDYSNE